jgi:phosphoenolpyruvate synthase/pyruvate phosphate dikinase
VILELSANLATKWSADEIGHKARNVAMLMAMGLPVPRGLVVPADAVNDCVQNAGYEFLAKYCLERLKPPLIVRSSASLEDSVEFSLAGQYDSVKGITDCKTFGDAFRACVVSITGGNTEVYCERMGLESASIRCSVLIQEQVELQCSGVISSRHPLQSDSPHLYLEWSSEPDCVVSGRGFPQSAIFPREQGSTQDRSSLMPFVADLCAGTLRVEEAIGMPAEVEWGWANEVLYFFQARPATISHPSTNGMVGVPVHYLSVIRGTPASFGSVSGTIVALDNRLTVGRNDLIVVSESGSKALLHALPSGAGIILLAGGLLSHAARLARELHIPMVVSRQVDPREVIRSSAWLVASERTEDTGLYIVQKPS